MDGQGKRQGVGLLSWETIRPYEEDPAPGTSAYLLLCGVRLLWPLVPVLSLWSRCPLHSQCRELRQVLKLTPTEGTTHSPFRADRATPLLRRPGALLESDRAGRCQERGGSSLEARCVLSRCWRPQPRPQPRSDQTWWCLTQPTLLAARRRPSAHSPAPDPAVRDPGRSDVTLAQLTRNLNIAQCQGRRSGPSGARGSSRSHAKEAECPEPGRWSIPWC